ncbi:DUF4037 domain-containing protein [Virgisporangium ochraceum]|uniref:DUF4037 domain-containing protein n=1 Tax=Virgisporangium ochraceum TaxID=65505 RepID=A0A8J4E8M8_9ACTN|nr:DUF4037 domain-containing protein [Virgisporangium ochraceum]GIJ65529.1 hypothetical protein Voc01_004460 [Virgisporangium ochraceum]
MRGLGLAEAFYREAVAPLLDGVPHAAALLGPGSEVLGFDDDVSTDHDFGPRVQVFVAAPDEVGPVAGRLDALPAEFAGFPVRYGLSRTPEVVDHHVEVTTPGRFFRRHLGTDPAGGMAVADWVLAPTQVLRTLTAGAVFHDPAGDLARRREALGWYPDDVWRYALAAGWWRVDQEEPFVGRTGARGDDLGSRILATRLVRDLMRLAFLIEREWAPYGKWFGRAFRDLRLGASVHNGLEAVLSASRWRDREAALVAAAGVLAAATNDLRLCEPVEATPRPFHDRDIRVLGAGRLTGALAAAITDPDVRALLARPVGTVDQAVDSTDILSAVNRERVAPLLGVRP